MIRPAQPEDAPAIAAIHAHVVAQTDPVITFTAQAKSTQEVCVALAEGHPYWIATEGASILGFAGHGPFRPGPGYGHTAEHSIALLPVAWGRGFGRALLGAVEADLRDRGYRTLIAAVGGENTAGIAFHTRLGFTETGRMPEVGWKAGRWQTLVLMQKTLSKPAPGR